MKSNIDQLTKLFQKLSNSKKRHDYIKTIEALKETFKNITSALVLQNFVNHVIRASFIPWPISSIMQAEIVLNIQ